MIAAMLLAVLAQVPDPFGDRWQLVSEDSDASYAIDPATITREGDRATVVIRARVTSDSALPFQIAVTRTHFDCAQQLTGIQAAQAYDAAGTQIRAMEVSPDQVRLGAFSDGPTLAIFAAVCRTD